VFVVSYDDVDEHNVDEHDFNVGAYDDAFPAVAHATDLQSSVSTRRWPASAIEWTVWRSFGLWNVSERI
jgi:hypothetical protein